MKVPQKIRSLFAKYRRYYKHYKINFKNFRELPKTVWVIAGGFVLCLTIFPFVTKKTPPTQKQTAQTVLPDSIRVPQKIAQLNSQTPIDLCYNHDVKRYIELYLGNRKPTLEAMMANAPLYFPIIESILDKYELPLELKYLAVVESGLNPQARSSSGAVGLWQFLYNTCSLVDLQVSSYIDERKDVYLSTDAACRYLKYLYSIYHDWNLAIASYNGGPGQIKNAILQADGETDFWKIRKHLSSETANYVPIFIAFNYLFSDTVGISPPKPRFSFSDIDTVYSSEPVYFEGLSKKLGISKEELVFLNPKYKKAFIPKGNPLSIIVLPKDKIRSFYKSEKEIYPIHPPKKKYILNDPNIGDTTNKSCMFYTVKRGDFFHKLAMKHNCTVENIVAWNNLDSLYIYPGQELMLWIAPKKDR